MATFGPRLATFGPRLATVGPRLATFGPRLATFGPSLASFFQHSFISGSSVLKMLDSTQKILVSSIRASLKAFLQFFSVTAPARSMGLKPGSVSGLV